MPRFRRYRLAVLWTPALSETGRPDRFSQENQLSAKVLRKGKSTWRRRAPVEDFYYTAFTISLQNAPYTSPSSQASQEGNQSWGSLLRGGSLLQSSPQTVQEPGRWERVFMSLTQLPQVLNSHSFRT